MKKKFYMGKDMDGNIIEAEESENGELFINGKKVKYLDSTGWTPEVEQSDRLKHRGLQLRGGHRRG